MINSETKYLICDSVGSASIQLLNEGVGSSGLTRFKGKFQEANAKNKNGRVYGYEILERERSRLNNIISERRLFGELDHPSDSIIHLENASHLITKLWWESNVMMGEGEILPTPAGKILETIIKCGIPVGISSRGVGSGKNNNEGVMVINSDFKLITFDVVADPSTHSAFVNEQNRINRKQENNSISQEIIKKNEQKSINTTNGINTSILIGYLNGAFTKSLNENLNIDSGDK